MITNLLFTALCLAIAYLVSLDVHSARRVQPVRVRAARDPRADQHGRN